MTYSRRRFFDSSQMCSKCGPILHNFLIRGQKEGHRDQSPTYDKGRILTLDIIQLFDSTRKTGAGRTKLPTDWKAPWDAAVSPAPPLPGSREPGKRCRLSRIRCIAYSERRAWHVSTRHLSFCIRPFSVIAPSVNVLRRTRRKPSTIRGAAPNVVIGQSTAARAGARPYQCCLCSPSVKVLRRTRGPCHRAARFGSLPIRPISHALGWTNGRTPIQS